MINFDEISVRAQIGLGLALIALLLYFIFVAKLPTKKSTKRKD